MLDELLSVSRPISLSDYENKVLPNFQPVHDDVYEATTGAAGINNLVDFLFKDNGIIRHAFYQHDENGWVFEAHVLGTGSVDGTKCRCLLSARFYSDFVEYTATFFTKTRILKKLRGDDCCFFHYNKDEEDSFLGWDAHTHTPQQRQQTRRQVVRRKRLPDLNENDHYQLIQFVRFLRDAVRAQKEGKPEPLRHGNEWAHNAYIHFFYQSDS